MFDILLFKYIYAMSIIKKRIGGCLRAAIQITKSSKIDFFYKVVTPSNNYVV